MRVKKERKEGGREDGRKGEGREEGNIQGPLGLRDAGDSLPCGSSGRAWGEQCPVAVSTGRQPLFWEGQGMQRTGRPTGDWGCSQQRHNKRKARLGVHPALSSWRKGVPRSSNE